MGVMECSRKDCDKIMCHTYVNLVGYICYDCQKEFKEYLQKNGLDPATEGEIFNELKKFMVTSKDAYTSGNEMSVDEFFNSRSR